MSISNLKNCRLFVENTQFAKNLSGIEMSNFSKNSVTAVFSNCSFSENLGDGLILSNSSLNKFYFKNCKFMNNYSNGLNLKLHESNLNNNYTKDASSLKYDIPVLFVIDCELTGNKNAGVLFKNSYLNIDNSRIKDNGKWAVEVVVESNKNLVKLINYGNELNMMINNPIGGSWGTLANKKSICSSQEGCFIL